MCWVSEILKTVASVVNTWCKDLLHLFPLPPYPCALLMCLSSTSCVVLCVPHPQTSHSYQIDPITTAKSKL